MDPIGLVIGVVSLAASLWIAWAQHQRAVRAEAELQNVLDNIPERVATQVEQVFIAVSASRTDEPPVAPESATNVGNEAATLSVQHPYMQVSYADIDGDGQNELLVQTPAGAHGSQLQVFTWKDWSLQLMASLGSSTPGGFSVADVDHDGRLELSTYEPDFSSGEPYVSAPQHLVSYRWNGAEFELVYRQPDERGLSSSGKG